MADGTRRENHEFPIPPELAGQRADAALARIFDGRCTRSQLKAALVSLTINGKTAKLAHVVAAGDETVVELEFPSAFAGVAPENLPLAIVHEDDECVVIDKPWGLPVHPAPGHWSGTLVNALLFHCGKLPTADAVRPGIVHRLDMDTSGLIVCAKTERALASLSAQFRAREVDKEYRAIVRGNMAAREGLIDAPLGRDPVNRRKQAVRPDGREARTGYRVLEEFPGCAHLAVDLYTGRTHQIRVHLASIHHPIVGDPVYSRHNPLCDKLCLAAVRLAFTHPGSGKRIEFTVAEPPHMLETLERLRTNG